MIKRLFILLSAATLIHAGINALSPRDAFVQAPRQVIASIDSITRLDMLDYFGSGAVSGSRNAFGGEVGVKLLTDNSIVVTTSRSSEVTIATLPVSRDTMLLVINTLALPASDSDAAIYTASWTKADAGKQLPGHNDLSLWLQPDAREKRSELENLLPFIPAIYTYNDGVLTMTHTLSRLLPKEEYSKIKKYLRPSLSYKWNGKKWKRVDK